MHTQSIPIFKYPRTPHLEGSKLQQGDTDKDQVSLASLSGLYCVIEEKKDGANSGVSFSGAADLLLQSRGHYLQGGGGERQFNKFKEWSRNHESRFLELLEDRYVMYGEWCASKHSIFYNALPHLFFEFDILDRHTGEFLSTKRRHAMLAGSPVLSVPVLYEGPVPTSQKQLRKLVFHSLSKTKDWKQDFETAVGREGLPLPLTWKQTDKSDSSEGLYIKIEDDNKVLARFKYVRPGFTQTILDSESHHLHRPILPNGLASGVDLYADTPRVTWESLGHRVVKGLDALNAVTTQELESFLVPRHA
ncbi:RNA ligase family protein [Nostoc sp. CHAB 5834]|nr:RNA ligase family protein [Nostoc sp. CHAB 5834]